MKQNSLSSFAHDSLSHFSAQRSFFRFFHLLALDLPMEFELPVLFNGKEISFPGKFLDYGYSSKIQIDIEGTMVLFEPDEERNWRALISYEDLQANKKLNPELLRLIAEALDAIQK